MTQWSEDFRLAFSLFSDNFDFHFRQWIYFTKVLESKKQKYILTFETHDFCFLELQCSNIYLAMVLKFKFSKKKMQKLLYKITKRLSRMKIVLVSKKKNLILVKQYCFNKMTSICKLYMIIREV